MRGADLLGVALRAMRRDRPPRVVPPSQTGLRPTPLDLPHLDDRGWRADLRCPGGERRRVTAWRSRSRFPDAVTAPVIRQSALPGDRQISATIRPLSCRDPLDARRATVRDDRRVHRSRHPLGPFGEQRPRGPLHHTLDADVAARNPSGPSEPFMILNDSRVQTGLGLERAGWWVLSGPFRLARWTYRRYRSRS